MIPLTELRLQNWVFDEDNDAVQISALATEKNIEYNGRPIQDGDDFQVEHPDHEGIFLTKVINPIPLTEEWLRKFGFEGNGIKYIGLDANCYYLQVTLNNLGSCLWNQEQTEFTVFAKIKYVHQLQNLYFALTGEELKYTPLPSPQR